MRRRTRRRPGCRAATAPPSRTRCARLHSPEPPVSLTHFLLTFLQDDAGEEELLVWYCVACEKHFKSAAAFDNHERSKKHLEAVELLLLDIAMVELGLRR